jgi:hypothetical protein
VLKRKPAIFFINDLLSFRTIRPSDFPSWLPHLTVSLSRCRSCRPCLLSPRLSSLRFYWLSVLLSCWWLIAWSCRGACFSCWRLRSLSCRLFILLSCWRPHSLSCRLSVLLSCWRLLALVDSLFLLSCWRLLASSYRLSVLLSCWRSDLLSWRRTVFSAYFSSWRSSNWLPVF